MNTTRNITNESLLVGAGFEPARRDIFEYLI
jgi:hypothetical protein